MNCLRHSLSLARWVHFDLRGWYCILLMCLSPYALAQPTADHSSCSSIGCHGGVQGQGPTWNSSLSTYVLHDPHARAYHVLLREDSRRIVYLYQRSVNKIDEPVVTKEGDRYTSAPGYNAFIKQHCANCHASQPPKSPASSHEMISCDSCHGSTSEGWVSEHVKGRAKSDPKTWPGFNDLRSLDIRAGTCINCHIGSIASEDQPYRQVTHDLIAAGHPAMRFEFSSYLASLPAHWDEGRDRWYTSKGKDRGRDRERPGRFWREAWSAGKIQSVDRSVELLKDQLRKIDDKAGNTTFTQSELAFPDFAQFDCFSCHQSLSPKLRPQKRSDLGRPKWLSWHASGLPAAAQGYLEPNRSSLDQFSWASVPQAEAAISNNLAPSWEEAAQSYLAYYACYLDLRDASTSWSDRPPLVPNVTPDVLATYRLPLEKSAAEDLLFSEDGTLQSPNTFRQRNRRTTAKQYETDKTPIATKLEEMRIKAAEMKIRIGK